jgi:hypothetical protein
MTVDVVRKAPFIDIKRIMVLPFAGRVLVNERQQVHPGELLAEAKIPSDLYEVDVAKGLGVRPREAKGFLTRDLGETLEEGDILAQSGGALPRLVRAPRKGLFLEFFDGKAVFAPGQAVIQLKADMIGLVETVIPEFGVILSAKGSLLQGVWGNQRSGEGNLRYLVHSSEDEGIAPQWGSVEEGDVVALGCLLNEADFNKLLDKDVSGLILHALRPELIPLAMSLSIPVIVLQGFGDLMPDPLTMGMLESRQGAVASINACLFDRVSGERPEVIIPGGMGEPGVDLGPREKLAVGHRVQVLSGKAIGAFGEVVALPEGKMGCESGLMVPTAEIRLESDETRRIPRTNLIILNG